MRAKICLLDNGFGTGNLVSFEKFSHCFPQMNISIGKGDMEESFSHYSPSGQGGLNQMLAKVCLSLKSSGRLDTRWIFQAAALSLLLMSRKYNIIELEEEHDVRYDYY